MSYDIAVLVSSYERPSHLLRVLHSIAGQVDVDGRFEVVVTDDGSQDETAEVVDQFAKHADFPVGFTTHPHETFQLARCRNEGVRASSAPYVLFLDGDCLIPPDHLRHHLDARKLKTIHAAYCVLLAEDDSKRLDVAAVQRGEFIEMASRDELKKLARMDRKARFYEFIRHPTKPKMFGGNVGMHRVDYETLNGYDENYEGWGCEDDDLRLRARHAGMRVRSLLRWTRTYHLWHPRGATTPDEWKQGTNVRYLNRARRPTRCERGLVDLRDKTLRAA